MYRPSMYNKHDESMYAFAELFNNCKVCNDVIMKPNDEETYGNDGYFIHSNGQKIGYDWEYRDRYFSNCRLQFDTLGQYERKLSKDCIQIAIQCDSTETGIAVGWHEDWLVEAKENRSLATDFERKEQGNTRYTHKYKIFSYEEVDNFSGRFHTDWLNMLFPRLRIARDLLCEDGLIMISMDENESTNLKKMCDEVFGESNYIGEIIRKTKSMTADNGNGFNTQHEMLVLYAKNKPLVVLHGEEKEFSNYSNPDDDPNGDWCPGDPSAKSGGATTSFGIENPYTHRIDYPPSGRYWAFSKTTLKKYIATGKIKFKTAYGEKERGFIFKRYKKDATSYYDPVHSLFATENEYMNQAATIEIKKLFGDNVFSYPKPVSFLKKLIQYATDEEDIVLDFFSGSATTAQAIIELNQEEETNRKFIMVQIPEALEESSIAYKQGFQTLCEIGCARIDKVLSESDSKEGYRYFKLDSSNMKEVFYRPSEVEQGSFGLYVDNIKEDRSSEDLLFQVMLEMGILLSSQMKETEIAGKKVYSVADDFLIACFDNDVTEETVKAVAEKKPHYAVFRDSSMANDSVASNFDQIFASVSPKTVRKVL